MTDKSDHAADLAKFTALGETDIHRLYLAAVFVASRTGTVCADDLRPVTLANDKQDRRIFGGALAQLSRKKILTTVGTKMTREQGSNARPISVFALTKDWRSIWLATDTLPIPKALQDLPTPETRAQGAQVSQDEVLAVLAQVAELSAAGATSPDPAACVAACVQICELTVRWLKR